MVRGIRPVLENVDQINNFAPPNYRGGDPSSLDMWNMPIAQIDESNEIPRSQGNNPENFEEEKKAGDFARMGLAPARRTPGAELPKFGLDEIPATAEAQAMAMEMGLDAGRQRGEEIPRNILREPYQEQVYQRVAHYFRNPSQEVIDMIRNMEPFVPEVRGGYAIEYMYDAQRALEHGIRSGLLFDQFEAGEFSAYRLMQGLRNGAYITLRAARDIRDPRVIAMRTYGTPVHLGNLVEDMLAKVEMQLHERYTKALKKGEMAAFKQLANDVLKQMNKMITDIEQGRGLVRGDETAKTRPGLKGRLRTGFAQAQTNPFMRFLVQGTQATFSALNQAALTGLDYALSYPGRVLDMVAHLEGYNAPPILPQEDAKAIEPAQDMIVSERHYVDPAWLSRDTKRNLKKAAQIVGVAGVATTAVPIHLLIRAIDGAIYQIGNRNSAANRLYNSVVNQRNLPQSSPIDNLFEDGPPKVPISNRSQQKGIRSKKITDMALANTPFRGLTGMMIQQGARTDFNSGAYQGGVMNSLIEFFQGIVSFVRQRGTDDAIYTILARRNATEEEMKDYQDRIEQEQIMLVSARPSRRTLFRAMVNDLVNAISTRVPSMMQRINGEQTMEEVEEEKKQNQSFIHPMDRMDKAFSQAKWVQKEIEKKKGKHQKQTINGRVVQNPLPIQGQDVQVTNYDQPIGGLVPRSGATSIFNIDPTEQQAIDRFIEEGMSPASYLHPRVPNLGGDGNQPFGLHQSVDASQVGRLMQADMHAQLAFDRLEQARLKLLEVQRQQRAGMVSNGPSQIGGIQPRSFTNQTIRDNLLGMNRDQVDNRVGQMMQSAGPTRNNQQPSPVQSTTFARGFRNDQRQTSMAGSKSGFSSSQTNKGRGRGRGQ